METLSISGVVQRQTELGSVFFVGVLRMGKVISCCVQYIKITAYRTVKMINNGTLTINNSNSENALTKGDIKKSYFGEWDDSASISKDHITVEYDYVAKVMDGKELSSLRRRNSLCCKEGRLLLFFMWHHFIF